MNSPEFREWLRYHLSAFPGIEAWLSKHKGPEVTRESIIQRWRDTLAYESLDEAKRATDRLLNGDEDEPRSYEKHPGAVRGICRRCRNEQLRNRAAEPTKKTIDGKPTVACLACKDTGYRVVWNPCCRDAALNGELYDAKRNPEGKHHGPHQWSAVRCPCDAGNRYRRWVVFDPARHCEPSKIDTTERYDEFIAWIDANSMVLHGGQIWNPEGTDGF